ncbi:MAG: hypothetical protein OEW42_11745 [Acidimicrobiia bacterium]|nr:hypothetical protein [Acidimicrobiia bacterium]
MAKPVATVLQSNEKVSFSEFWSVLVVRICDARHAITQPRPIPINDPITPATNEYSQPSVVNAPTSGSRRSPNARSIPSSPRRSSASITKMFTSNNTPAATANMPMVKYSWVRPSAAASASSSRSRFTGRATFSVPASTALIASSASSVRGTPDSTPPTLENATWADGGSAAAVDASGTPFTRSARVPGATSTL